MNQDSAPVFYIKPFINISMIRNVIPISKKAFSCRHVEMEALSNVSCTMKGADIDR